MSKPRASLKMLAQFFSLRMKTTKTLLKEGTNRISEQVSMRVYGQKMSLGRVRLVQLKKKKKNNQAVKKRLLLDQDQKLKFKMKAQRRKKRRLWDLQVCQLIRINTKTKMTNQMMMGLQVGTNESKQTL